MSEPIVRYIAGVVLCAVVALAYAATRKEGTRAILIDGVKCFAVMAGVVLGVAAVVLALCALK